MKSQREGIPGSYMVSFRIQVGGSELSGGKAEKVGRVRCERASNGPAVLYRVVFMRLFSAGGRKPWGRIDISRMSPLGSTAPFLYLAGPRGSVQMANRSGSETHTKRQSTLHFLGGRRCDGSGSSPGDPPHSRYGLRKDHVAGGTFRNSLAS